MKSEIKNCQNCKKDFTIEPDDFSFYEKIKVPLPTWCSGCRMIRRFSFQNTWSIHWRNCDKCGNKTLSMYLPEQKIIVYCQKCWWADDWDGTEYAMDYDSTRPFFDQFKELNDKVPHTAITSEYTTLKNSEFSNALAWSKDCYLVFWADFCENVYYSTLLNGLKYSADCLRAQNSELCYESIGINRCYQTYFSEECDDCVDVWFSRNCYNCTKCIGCVNLRGEKNCIFNIKYSNEDFAKKIKELDLSSWLNIKKIEKDVHNFWLTKPRREYNGNSLNKNVTGEGVFNSKDSKEMYFCVDSENCKYCQFITVPKSRDCFDYSGWGNNVENIYESTVVGENSNSVYFSIECWPDSFNLQYCYYNISGKNNFGCSSLKRKQYCILNKQYTKESFDKLRARIIEDMKVNPYVDKLGRKYYYGEFFPIEFSDFEYNRSNAIKFFPKTKEGVLKEGYSWSDELDSTHDTTFNADNLPNIIKDVDESILDEIIECSNCHKGYKIAKGELNLLRKMNLPIPHECPKCRQNRRFERILKPIFYKRKCMKCNEGIYTAYSPDRPEIVYCVKCYQAEFI